ncbi:MAG: ribokinase [Ignavibacteriaceae bacterium]
MMSKDGVLVVGSANMDLVITADRFPKPGETIFGKKFQMFPGGKGANQAVGSAKLGCKTFFIGKLGDDDFCQRLSQNMKKAGVELSHLLIDNNESTGTALISVDGEGQNEIIVISGSNMKLSPADIEDSKDIFRKVRVVLTQLEIPLETVIKAAELSKQSNTIFILNPAPAQKLPDNLLNLVDYLTPNEIELEVISGVRVTDQRSAEEAAKILLDKGVKNVIVTMGSKGSLLVNREKVKLFPANKVIPVDTTAAGDSFNGALAYSLCMGKGVDEAIKFSNKAASISVTRMGAQSSMPVIEEVNNLIEVY